MRHAAGLETNAGEAVALAREAVRLISATDGSLEQADVYVALGETYRVLGDADDARDAYMKAIRRYEAKGAEPFAVLTHARLARISD